MRPDIGSLLANLYRPSFVAPALLALGALSLVACQPSESTAVESGSVTLGPDAPTAGFRIVADGGEADLDRLSLGWTLVTETGVPARLSVTTTREDPGFWMDPAAGEVLFDTSTGVAELTVLNFVETGTTTLRWDAEARRGGDRAIDLGVVVEPRAHPSATVAIPDLWRFDDGEAFAVSDVEVTVDEPPTSDGVGWERDGETTIVVWPSPCDDGCALTFTVPQSAAGRGAVTIDPGLDEATTTVVTRDAPTATTWVRVSGPADASESRTVRVEIAVPDEAANPFAGRVFLAAALAGDHPDPDGSQCRIEIRYGREGPDRLLTGIVGAGLRGAHLELEPGETVAYDVEIGDGADPGGSCGLEPGAPIPIEIGVVTFGVDEPRPADVRLR